MPRKLQSKRRKSKLRDHRFQIRDKLRSFIARSEYFKNPHAIDFGPENLLPMRDDLISLYRRHNPKISNLAALKKIQADMMNQIFSNFNHTKKIERAEKLLRQKNPQLKWQELHFEAQKKILKGFRPALYKVLFVEKV